MQMTLQLIVFQVRQNIWRFRLLKVQISVLKYLKGLNIKTHYSKYILTVFQLGRSRADNSPAVIIKNYLLLEEVHFLFLCTKLLGVFIDNNLSWDGLVDNVCKRIFTTCFPLKCLSPHCKPLKGMFYSILSPIVRGLDQAYFGLIQPVLIMALFSGGLVMSINYLRCLSCSYEDNRYNSIAIRFP